MRIATSSIPREELHKILLKQINPKTPEDYKKIARFYLQAERYENAQQALDAMLAAFPDQPDLKEQLKPSMRSIAQLSAQQLLNELKLRRGAGQHKLVSEKLKAFSPNDVSGEILQGFRQMSQEYDVYDTRLRETTKQLQELSSRIKDPILQQDLHPILAEIADDGNIDTLDRLASFLQNADDKDTPDSEKVSLAISGWVLGADAATTRIDTAVSAYRVRDLLRQYLAETDSTKREGIFRSIRKEYAGDVATVTAVAAHMKPPLDPPEPKPGKSGYYELKTPGVANTSEITYYVQLPPEYNPYRRYPTIVTLNGLHNSVENQVDWWAGAWKNGERTGQAARHGYIVIAPVWILGDQNQYGYSSRELAAVLNPLRDACRRFSIDTDRVYLSGHSLGGDAAWDIGLAHPDLWAGVIPIAGRSDRYCTRYWKNAEYVPYYVVAGELDGNKNAQDLNRYLTHRFETTVVEYIGRGHDNFYDEIQRLFQWTALHKRNFFPREFACESMREWDNSFWWVEMDGMPAKSVIDPADWPPPSSAQTVKVSGSITNKNTINVRSGSSRTTVWLAPEMLDFKQRAIITVNGQRINKSDQIIDPDLMTILEDLRTRADRQHPFWAKLEAGRK
jgi:pimeloyl-ACP methyl ester carboxylesterase